MILVSRHTDLHVAAEPLARHCAMILLSRPPDLLVVAGPPSCHRAVICMWGSHVKVASPSR